MEIHKKFNTNERDDKYVSENQLKKKKKEIEHHRGIHTQIQKSERQPK